MPQLGRNFAFGGTIFSRSIPIRQEYLWQQDSQCGIEPKDKWQSVAMEIKEHVTQCNRAARWDVVIMFCTTMVFTEEDTSGRDRQTILGKYEFQSGWQHTHVLLIKSQFLLIICSFFCCCLHQNVETYLLVQTIYAFQSLAVLGLSNVQNPNSNSTKTLQKCLCISLVPL